MDDNTPMPFGKHKGTKLANVPADYLLWLYRDFPELSPELKKYIRENWEVLQNELKEKK